MKHIFSFQTCCLLITVWITVGLVLNVLISLIYNTLDVIGRPFMFHETVTTRCLGLMWKMSSRLHKVQCKQGKWVLSACNVSDCCQIKRTICILSREQTVYPFLWIPPKVITQWSHIYLQLTGSMLFNSDCLWKDDKSAAGHRRTAQPSAISHT